MRKYFPDKKMTVMTRDQVRAFDKWAINTLAIPGVTLMENAGRSCAELVKSTLEQKDQPKVTLFCGTGNNGGDGYVIARHLLNAGFRITLALCGNHQKVKGDAKVNLDIIYNLGQKVTPLEPEDSQLKKQITDMTDNADMIVDAIFGTGLRGQIKPEYIPLLEKIDAVDIPKLAVDIPSGLDCDTGQSLGAVISADYTVTFAAVKKGFTISEDSRKYTGQIYVASIGVEPCFWKSA